MSELTRREETERAFLALCIASPEDGAAALEGLDIDEHFSSGLLRRAARRLRAGDLLAPMSDPAGAEERLEDDPQLKGLLAELVVEAGRERADGGDARGPAPAVGARARRPPDPARARAGRGGHQHARAAQGSGQTGLRPGLRAGVGADGGSGGVKRRRAAGRAGGGPGWVSDERAGRRGPPRALGCRRRPRSRRSHRVGAEESQTGHRSHTWEHMFV